MSSSSVASAVRGKCGEIAFAFRRLPPERGSLAAAAARRIVKTLIKSWRQSLSQKAASSSQEVKASPTCLLASRRYNLVIRKHGFLSIAASAFYALSIGSAHRFSAGSQPAFLDSGITFIAAAHSNPLLYAASQVQE